MKQAVMTGPGSMAFREVPVPSVQPGTVLVKIDAVGLCTWEQKFFKGVPGSYPFVGGHEICGTVVEVGEGVSQPLVPGDVVAVASLTRCGECYYCRRGMDNLCEHTGEESTPGQYWGPGGFSEYFLARGYEIYKLDQRIDRSVGTLAEPLACVVRSIDRGSIGIGDTVVVLGAGVMGILHLLVAKSIGAKVVVSEVDEGRKARAASFGADLVVDPTQENLVDAVRGMTAGRGAEVVFFTAGGKGAIMGGLPALAKNGRMVIYGATKSTDILEIDPKIFHYDEIFITGVTKHTKETFRRATELINGGNLGLERLVSRQYPFERIEDGLNEAGSLSTYRIVVRMDGKASEG